MAAVEVFVPSAREHLDGGAVKVGLAAADGSAPPRTCPRPAPSASGVRQPRALRVRAAAPVERHRRRLGHRLGGARVRRERRHARRIVRSGLHRDVHRGRRRGVRAVVHRQRERQRQIAQRRRRREGERWPPRSLSAQRPRGRGRRSASGDVSSRPGGSELTLPSTSPPPPRPPSGRCPRPPTGIVRSGLHRDVHRGRRRGVRAVVHRQRERQRQIAQQLRRRREGGAGADASLSATADPVPEAGAVCVQVYVSPAPSGRAAAPVGSPGSAVALSDAAAAQPHLHGADALLSDLTLTFSLTVNDGTNTSTAATVDVTVEAGTNDAPTADAGTAQTVAEAAAVTLDGSGSSDPEGAGLTYTWTQTAPASGTGSAVALSDAAAASPTFTAPTQLLSDLTLTFSLTVNDGTNTSTAATVDVTVEAGTNDAPTADAGTAQTVAEAAAVTLDGSGSSDPEGAGLTYTWTQTAPASGTGSAVALSDAAAASPTFTAPTQLLSDLTLTFSLTVNDGTNTSTAATVDVTVEAGTNDAPTADAGTAQTVAEAAAVTLDGSGSSDPEGAGLTYTWTQTAPASGTGSAVALSDAAAASPTFTAPTQLLSDLTLTFSLTVNDGTNTSTAATVDVTVIAVPAAPTNLAATPSDGQVALTWDDPGDDTITKYQVSSDGGTSFADIAGSGQNTTAHTVTELTNGTAHTLAVRAVNGSGNGSASTVTVTMVPAATTNLAATPGDGQVTLSWTDPGDATIDKYQVSSDGGTSFADIAGSGASTTTHTVTGLTNGTDYTLAVRAVNASGNGAVATVGATPVAVPAVPSGLNAAVTGDSQVALTWDNPGNTTITGYELRVDNGAWAAIADSDADTTSHTVTGLNDGATYNFHVRAVNDSGPGVSAYVDASIPHSFEVPAAPSNLTAAAGDGAVTLSWTDPGNATIGKYQISSDGGTSFADIAGSGASTTSHIVTGLTNGTAYGFALRAVNASGTGAVSSIAATPRVAVAGVPAAPAGLSATPGDGQVTLSWTDPGDATIDKYQVSSDGGTSFADIAGSGASTTSHIVRGLTNGTAYGFALRAVNASGTGAVSSIAATPLAVPAAPSNLAATGGDARVTLTWVTADDSITGWQYRQKEGAGDYGDWTGIAGSGPGTTAHAVDPLVNGTAYTFRVRAVNAAGNGAPSAERTATPRPGNNPPTVAAPLADRTLIVGATVTVDVSAAFDDHDNDALTYTAVSGDTAALTVTEAALTLTGVAAGTATVTVTASDGEDSASDAFAVTVEADTQPSFASDIADRTYTRGAAITTLTLPLASGGNGALSYSLTPAPPAGLVFDPDARTLSGTPTAAQAATAYTYRAEDADGDVAGQSFTIEVTAENIPLTVVSFQDSTYTATEGGMAATITVHLSQASNEELAIPIRVTRPETTEVGDYTVEGLEDWDAHAGTGTLTFPADATQQTWSIAANHDGDGDDETLEVGFGELPEMVVAGAPAAATVTLEDKGLVALKVSFGQPKYTVSEGQQVNIDMKMSPAADRRVEVPLVTAPSGGATEEDYGEMPASVVFEEGESQRTISVAATMDEVNDAGEGIVLNSGGLPEMVSTGDPASTQVHFMQRRSEEQFSQTQEAMLAVVARSMAESAQTAIEGRFERHRQWSHLGSSGGAASTPSPAHDDRTTTPSRRESVWIDSEGAGGEAAEGSLVHNAWGAAKTNAATESGWNSDNPETGAPGSWLPSFSLGSSLGSSGNLGHSDRNHLGAAPGAGMELGGRVYGQDRLYGSGVAGAPLAAGSGDFSGMRAQDPSLSGVSFEMALGEREQETSWVLVLWGQGDLQHFNGDLTRLGMEYRGGLDAAHVGLDLYANERMLAGLSFMRSWGDMDYTDDGIDGVLASRMDTVHPYVYWQPNARVGVWGIGGLGGGEVDVEEPGRVHDFDADFRMFAGGVRAVLSRRGNNELGLRADAFTAQLQTDALEDIAKVSGQAHRGRLMLEWVHNRALSAGRSLSLKAEVGGRFDGGDADRGSGVETGFRLAYLDAIHGLDVALHGRMLVVHESDYRDWGAAVQASWDPGEKQRGFRGSLMSSWGQDGGGRTTLWDNAAAVTRPVGTGALGLGTAFRMQSEVAYGGMKAPGLAGLLTPYSRLRWAGQGREVALGASWNPAESRQSALPLTIELEALRRENRTDPSHHELLLRVSIPLGGSTGVMPTADGTRQEATFVGQGTPRGAAESHADNVGATAAAPELPAAPASARQPDKDTKLPPEPVATEQALPASQPSSASVWPQDGSPQAKATTPLPGSTVAPGRGLVVQLGAFRSYEKSARFTDQLRQAGYAARTVHGSDYNRVVVGPFPTRTDAAAAQWQLDQQGYRGYVRPDPGVLDRS